MSKETFKLNAAKTCNRQGYCSINRTPLVRYQNDPHLYECPVCSAVYDPNWTPPKTKMELYKEAVNRKYGWSSITNRKSTT